MKRAGAEHALARALGGEREEFGDFFLSRLLGFDIGYTGDACTVAFDAEPFLFNPQGTLHGGILSTALDVSMGHLLRHVTGSAGTTLEFKVQFLGAVRSGRVICAGRMLRQGRSICFLRAEASDETGEVAAFATSTWKLLSPRG
jgi:uncharacterized protein (TIGR00369 family)